MEPILQIENLTHTYSAGTPFQRSAVEGLSMTVGAGEFLGVIGHTGSGKSTLIQHLNGLLQPTSGRILLEGKDIWADPKKIRDVRFKVGLVFQYPEYQLFEETVYKDIAFGPKNMGLDAEEIARNVDRIVVLSDGKVYMEGTPKQVFARAHELEQVGLDVPQVTKVAAALKARGLDIDTAVYTVEALEQKLLTLRGGASPC